MRGKKGQVTIFAVIAVVILVGIAAFAYFRGGFFVGSVPAEFVPLYDAYSKCIENAAESGVDLLSTQGGKIDVGAYAPGSEYAPFASQMNFLGSPVPYWMYVSGNGLIKEQVPTKGEMERELGDFISENLRDCNLEAYYQQGFSADLGEASVKTTINDNSIDIEVNADVVAYHGEDAARKGTHRVQISRKLGSMYKTAVQVYDKEKRDAFLEEYSVDVLRLYAPVDGVEVSCAPKIWKTGDVVAELQTALANNIGALRTKGGNYDLANKEREYFVIDETTDEPVSFMYQTQWPSKVEITPATQALMVANPVGNQEGLGIMGFCYVPYHFVYDVSFPVMVQVGDGTELFQFPVVVVIDNNVPREANLSEVDYLNEDTEDLCNNRVAETTLSTYDAYLSPVEANLKYQCFDQVCDLGQSVIENGRAVLRTTLPQCVNGYLIADSDGYAQKRQLYSSTSANSADVILDRNHDVSLNILVDGRSLSGTALVTFTKDGNTVTAALPDVNDVNLSEGTYSVSVSVYSESSITIPASTQRKCQEVPEGGIAGFFGKTTEQCFNIDLPETKLDYALVGGGQEGDMYLFDSDLEKGKMTLSVSGLPEPSSLEDIQYNYEAYSSGGIEITYE